MRNLDSTIINANYLTSQQRIKKNGGQREYSLVMRVLNNTGVVTAEVRPVVPEEYLDKIREFKEESPRLVSPDDSKKNLVDIDVRFNESDIFFFEDGSSAHRVYKTITEKLEQYDNEHNVRKAGRVGRQQLDIFDMQRHMQRKLSRL